MVEYSDNVKRIIISENEKASIKKLYEQAVVDTKKLESMYTDFVSNGNMDDANEFVNLFVGLTESQQIELLKLFIEYKKDFKNIFYNTYARQMHKITNKKLFNALSDKYQSILKAPTKQPAAQPAANTAPANPIDDFKAKMNAQSAENFKKLAGQELASKDRLIVRDPELKELQTKLGVNADGVLGPNTWNKMKEKGLLGIMIRALDTQKGMAVDQKQKVAPLAVNKPTQVKTIGQQPSDALRTVNNKYSPDQDAAMKAKQKKYNKQR
jgi:hypothetical protein